MLVVKCLKEAYSVAWLFHTFTHWHKYLPQLFPRAIFDWNKLHITTPANVSVEEFQDTLANF